MKKGKIAALALCGVLAVGGVVGGAYALYNASTGAVENTFTIKAGESGKALDEKDVIEEKDWVGDRELAPLQEQAKTPIVSNIQNYTAWVMMEVDVPLISKVYIDGTEKTDYEAVTLNRVANGATNSTSIFSAANTLESDVAENWTLLGTATITDKSNNKYKAYYFGYNTVLDGKTDTATASTSALFTSIQIPNITKLETNFPGEVLIKAQFVQQSDDYDSIAGAYHKYFKGQVATNVTDLVSAPTSTSTENN